MDMYTRIRETIDDMTDDEVVEMWNEYCDKNRYYDDRVENMSFLDDDLSSMSPTDIINLIEDETFSTNDGYYFHTIYGITSFNSWDDYESPIDADDLTNYIINNDDELNNQDIRDILDDEEEEEEEE